MTREEIAVIAANILENLNTEEVNLLISILTHYNTHIHNSQKDRTSCLLNGCPLNQDHPLLVSVHDSNLNKRCGSDM